MIPNIIQNPITKSAQIIGTGALLALCAGAAQAEGLTNTGFESPDASTGDTYCSSGWTCFNDVFTTSNLFDSGNQSPPAAEGTQVLKMFGPLVDGNAAGAFQDFTPVPNAQHTASVLVQNWTEALPTPDPLDPSNLVGLQLIFYDANGIRITSTETFASSDPDLTEFTYLSPNEWVMLSVAGVPTADAIAGRVQILHIQTGAEVTGGNVFYDDASLAVAGIDIEKLTNGMQADQSHDPDVPRITQGMTVNWTYEVTNTGYSAFPESEILVFDNQPGIDPILDTGSDVGDDMILSPGEKWIYNASAQALDLTISPPWITVVPGCYRGQNTYQNIGWVWVNGGESYDEDTSHYCNPVDSDNDGLPDNIEDSNNNGIVDAGETDPFNPDSDNDGVLDGHEDTNANGMIDSGEADPLNPDTDGDGLTDGYEINVGGTDPTSTTPLCANPGDMNGDGEVNVGDLLLLQRQIMGL